MDKKRKSLASLLSLHSKTSAASPESSAELVASQNSPVSDPVSSSIAAANISLGQVSDSLNKQKLGKPRDKVSAEECDIGLKKGKKKHCGPIEMSLTRRAPPPLWKQHRKTSKERVIRDPRFDDMSGHLDISAFSKNYQFLAEMRQKERATLQQALSQAENPVERRKIKIAIQRIDNQEREKQKIMEERSIKKQEKDAMISALKEGRRPILKKKSDHKLEVLVKNYQALKKDNKLDKYLERKEKKKRAKELFK
ncbi:hypothetical protein HAZT_HAZT003065 [Hyalella azteca]|uniref:rRNA biogenesis protein RRP36 n=1 Tax=Hyalella azteca TaxID=294128 RepID=A0A6A0H5M6_HYAAZ|nr:ribosomal RNA processing protein 36 homolog [Hyalella azteca]KAA0200652.1 hypothetical protein HAZT_HAZT003065 [Hyalella azteca]